MTTTTRGDRRRLHSRDRYETREGVDDYYYKRRPEEANATLRSGDRYEMREGEEIDDYNYRMRLEETATLRSRD
jgi:hypothetical protein